MEYIYKEVYFDQYCKTCKYEEVDESKEPCDECLHEPKNLHSHKPIKWVSKKE